MGAVIDAYLLRALGVLAVAVLIGVVALIATGVQRSRRARDVRRDRDAALVDSDDDDPTSSVQER